MAFAVKFEKYQTTKNVVGDNCPDSLVCSTPEAIDNAPTGGSRVSTPVEVGRTDISDKT